MKFVKSLFISVAVAFVLMVVPSALNANASRVHVIHHARYSYALTGNYYVRRSLRGKRVYNNQTRSNICIFNPAGNAPLYWKANKRESNRHVTYYHVISRKYDGRHDYSGWIPAQGIVKENGRVNKLVHKFGDAIENYTMSGSKRAKRNNSRKLYKLAKQFKNRGLHKAALQSIKDNR